LSWPMSTWDEFLFPAAAIVLALAVVGIALIIAASRRGTGGG
jgi:ABC-type polysaccharide/polyol phosphate export permease